MSNPVEDIESNRVSFKLFAQLSKFQFDDNNIIIYKAMLCLYTDYVIVNKKLPYNGEICGASLNDKAIFDSYLKHQFIQIKNTDNRFIAATLRLNQLLSIQGVIFCFIINLPFPSTSKYECQVNDKAEYNSLN
jgi:hypothetical protein